MALFNFNSTLKNKNYKVAIYFYGTLRSINQLEIWKKNFEILDRNENISIVVRDLEVYQYLLKTFSIDLFYAYTIDELITLYEDQDFRTILYVNNGFKNFQSLIYHRAMHIYINHDETEESFMSANQAKGYDYIFVSGNSAVNRYKKSLIKFDTKKLVKIGRPHYDFINFINKSEKKVILFSPKNIVEIPYLLTEFLLLNETYHLIYAPQNINKSLKDINKLLLKNIKTVINKNQLKFEANVEQFISIDISKNNYLEQISLSDIVILDYSMKLIIETFYFTKPIIVNNLQVCNKPILEKEFIFSIENAIVNLNIDSIEKINNMDIEKIIFTTLENDEIKEERKKLKKSYFGNLKDGESSQLFISKIQESIEEQNRYLQENGMLNTIH